MLLADTLDTLIRIDAVGESTSEAVVVGIIVVDVDASEDDEFAFAL